MGSEGDEGDAVVAGCCICNRATCPGLQTATLREGMWRRLAVGVAMIETILLAMVAAFIVGKGADGDGAISLYAALGIYCATAFLYFFADGAFTENSFQFAAGVMASMVMTAVITFKVFREPHDLGQWWVENRYYVFVAKCAFQLVYFVVFFPTLDSFGYFAYKVLASSNLTLQKMYNQYRIFLTLLKLDIYFSGLMLMTANFFLFIDWTLDDTLDIAAFGVSLLWAVLGWVTLEKKRLVVLFLLLSVVEPVYVVFQLIDIRQDVESLPDTITANEVTLIGVAAVGVRVALAIATIVVSVNFGNLRPRVFERATKTRRPLGGLAEQP